MNFTEKILLEKTYFTEIIIKENNLDNFNRWIFYPGMLFNSLYKWWDDKGLRNKCHEGLDLCLFEDGKRKIIQLNERINIPVMYDGIVVIIFDDFLGKTIIVEHSLFNNKFCTIYAHTNPKKNLYVGSIVKQKEIIATISNSNNLKNKILPHLHISLACVNKFISYEKLNWNKIANSDELTLIDPIDLIDWEYKIL